MKKSIALILSRLKSPTVVLSIASNIISLSLLLGYKLNESVVMATVTILCSILVTLGIMKNPDVNMDNMHLCLNCKEKTFHVEAAGNKICTICATALDARP